MKLTIFNTYIHPLAHKKVMRVLDSTYLSEGSVVREFESEMQVYFNIPNVVALNSGTSALHLAVALAKIKPGDEVIIPAQTFIATGLAVLYERGVPVFADIDYETGNISPESIRKKITKKTKAIIVVDWGGHPCDMDSILAIAQEHKLTVIEDAAHALGASYKNKPVGSISDITCFSFQAIKHLTTGDGGAISCKREETAHKARALRWFGIDRRTAAPTLLGERKYNLSSTGFKYHMNNYAAALGIGNLKGFGGRLKKRTAVALYYRKELSKVNGISLFYEASDVKSAYWLFGFHVERRNDFIRCLKDHGIEASVVHQRIDRNSIFGGVRKDLVNQERFDKTQIHIPIHDGIDKQKAQYIVNTIKKGW